MRKTVCIRHPPPDAGIHTHVHTLDYFLSAQKLPQERGKFQLIILIDIYYMYACIGLFCQFRIIKLTKFYNTYKVIEYSSGSLVSCKL